MLSVLIALYDSNAFNLAKAIVDQALKLDIDFELICIDDASFSPLNVENEKINSLTNAKFIAETENAGYRGNRNNLAAMSKYEYLLFIDGDSTVFKNTYVKDYIDSFSTNEDIIYGGRIHPNKIADKNKKLRWKYGKFIEDKSASSRKKQLYKSLKFNNTVIKKDCFNNIKFDTSISKYGHDDTLFAYQASQANLRVKHIDNPIKHEDLDTNEIFIEKTKEGLKNLLQIYRSKKIDIKFVKILRFYILLKKLYLAKIVSILYQIFNPVIEKQLKSSRPSLMLFNFYKIGYLCNLK